MKRTLLIFSLLIISISVFAQDLDVAGPIERFLTNTVRPAYGPVLALVTLVTGLFNIGKVTNPDDRDWKGFGYAIGRLVLIALILIAVIEFLVRLTINI